MKSRVTPDEKKTWATPGNAISLAEFKKGIKEAELGPFHSIEKSKKKISEWRKRRNSL